MNYDCQLLYDKARKHQSLNDLSDLQIRQALNTCESIFSDFEVALEAGFNHIIVRHHNIQTPIDIIDELTPALAIAHSHFDESLPEDLIAKITNETQIADTIFELKCLGVFRPYHEVLYEPSLQDGKVPDLMLKLGVEPSPDVYIECKSQHIQESEYNRIFQRSASAILDVMKGSPLPKIGFGKGYRTEVHLERNPTNKDILHLSQTIPKLSLEDLTEGVHPCEGMKLIAVPKGEPSARNSSMCVAEITVTDKPTGLGHANAHLLVHCWPSLESRLRKLQRSLLSKARRKLRNIPGNSIGMVCMQTYGVRNFLIDLRSLLTQDEFGRVPLVWVNPFQESQVVFRSDFLELRNVIFDELIDAKNGDLSETQDTPPQAATDT